MKKCIWINCGVCILLFLGAPNILFAQNSKERIVARMKMDDKNSDGKLTKSEFTGPERLFQQMDEDGDGIVIIQEETKALNEPKNTTRLNPDYTNVKYGEHERHGFDIYLAKNEGESPTALMIWIHGGGFRNGDKSQGAGFAKYFTEKGISYICLNYRLSHQDIAPACFHDCARALQFIRHNAEKWNIDKSRIAVGGGSAGAGLAQWMAFSPDMADPGAEDPVLHESSRVQALILLNAQTSYDPRWIKKHIPGNAWRDQALHELYDINIDSLYHLSEEKYKLFEYCSPVNYFSKDDPPMIFLYRRSKDPDVAVKNAMDGIHHPIFGFALKDLADEYGVECEIFTVENENDMALYNGRWDYILSFLERQFDLQ